MKSVSRTVLLCLIFVAVFVGGHVRGEGLRQFVPLDGDGHYEIRMFVMAEGQVAGFPNMEFTLFLQNKAGETVDHLSVNRGMPLNQWYPFSIAVQTSADITRGEIHITSEESVTLSWNELSVTTIDTSSDGIREQWEARLEQYGMVYTGLVVDARGFNIQRGMSPRIHTESGQLLYGGVQATMDYISRVGIVGYGQELSPTLYQRISVSESYPYALPMEVDAIDVIDPSRTSVVVSDQDGQRIIEALAAYDFLTRHSVIILLD